MSMEQAVYNPSNKVHETALRAYRDLHRDYWMAHANRSTSGHAIAESLSHAFERLHSAGCPMADIEEAASHAMREAMAADAQENWPDNPPSGDRFGLMLTATLTRSRRQAATLHNAIWDLRQAVEELAAHEPVWAGTLLRDSERETLETVQRRLQQWVSDAAPVRK